MILALLLALAVQDFPSRALHPHAGSTDDARLTPEGKLLVTRGAPDRTVKVWIAETGKLLYTLADKAEALAMSADGTSVAVGGAFATTVWDPANGGQTQKLETGWTGHLAYSRDGKALTTVSARPQTLTVARWDLKGGQKTKSFDIPMAKDTIWRALGADGTLLALPMPDRTVRVWDVEKEKEVQRLAGHGDKVTALSFSPDGRALVTAGSDHTVRIWDVESGRERKRLSDGYEADPQIAFSRDGAVMAVVADAGIEFWETKSDRKISVYRPPSTGVFVASFVEIAADAKTLIAGGLFIAKDAPKDKKTTGPLYFWKIKR